MFSVKWLVPLKRKTLPNISDEQESNTNHPLPSQNFTFPDTGWKFKPNEVTSTDPATSTFTISFPQCALQIIPDTETYQLVPIEFTNVKEYVPFQFQTIDYENDNWDQSSENKAQVRSPTKDF